MRTLHVDLGQHWRGGQSQALLLLQGLRERGHVAELVTVRKCPLASRAVAEGIPVHTVGRRAARLQAALRLRQLLVQGPFDLLHLHDAHSLTPAWLAGAHRHLCVVASRRVAYRLKANRLALAPYRALRRILAVSRFVAESVIASGLPTDHVEVVYDGITVPPLPSPEARRQARQRWDVGDNDYLLGCVGYLLPEKGQEFLIRALPTVRARFPSCRLLLAGNGPCRARLERLARELGICTGVRFAGFVEDVTQVYAALDLFLFPSRAEPLGSSLLTAMAYALPVVAVARGAVPEVVEDGRTGLLVPDPDPASIAAAVVRLLRDARLSAHLGLAARETIQQRFTVEQMVENTLHNYRQVCSPRGRL